MNMWSLRLAFIPAESFSIVRTLTQIGRLFVLIARGMCVISVERPSDLSRKLSVLRFGVANLPHIQKYTPEKKTKQVGEVQMNDR